MNVEDKKIDIYIYIYILNVEEQMYKMCTKCFNTLPFKMFYNCLRNYDRKASWCEQCMTKSKKVYIQRRKLYYSSQIFR